MFEEYPELKSDKVKLDGDNDFEFAFLIVFQHVTLIAVHWEEWDKRLVIKEALMVH